MPFHHQQGNLYPKAHFLSSFSFECQVIDGGEVWEQGAGSLGGQGTSSFGTGHTRLGDRAEAAWGQGTSSLGRRLGGIQFLPPRQIRASLKCGHNFRGPQSLTVAILAQGTHWAVAVTQALFVGSSILGERAQRQRAYTQRDKPQQALAWPMSCSMSAPH